MIDMEEWDRNMDWYKEFCYRLKRSHPDIDVSKYNILLDNKTLDGVAIASFTLSQDERWMCIPVEEETEYGIQNIPMCFEVAAKCECYLPSGSLVKLVRGWLLYKRI